MGDGLTRYPSLSSPQGVLRGLDLFGTVVFAYSGCVTAGQAGMDLLGCTIVGTITAVGGGTVRDLLLGDDTGARPPDGTQGAPLRGVVTIIRTRAAHRRRRRLVEGRDNLFLPPCAPSLYHICILLTPALRQ
eukprot:TRINITY_DN11823_c0_g1_i1.p1 TRINITY_DN11823_c0_g1~~TRINITY_DN11823_c0_g1_i1.p1  ORF type:complete len:139 (-),score=1.34 TRINITY_DN11823_c0_g1_i1:381-776(-)